MREFDLNGLRLAEYQGKIFELSYDLGCSSKIFLRRFLHSDLLRLIDKNDSSRLLLIPEEGIREIEEQFGSSDYGKEKFSKESLFWMGYLYRYISYTRDTETRILMKIFKPEKMNELYYVYHTQDLEWRIQDLLEMQNLSEDVFDRNKRLKKLVLKNYGHE